MLGEKPTNNSFIKKPEEVRKILELCVKNNIPVTGTVFRKTASELEQSIDFIKENYGSKYLIPGTIYMKHMNQWLLAIILSIQSLVGQKKYLKKEKIN